MTLDTYLGSEGAKSLTALSLEIGVSKSRLSQLRDSIEWPPNLAMKVEIATCGAMDAAFLSSIVARARLAPTPDPRDAAEAPAQADAAEAA